MSESGGIDDGIEVDKQIVPDDSAVNVDRMSGEEDMVDLLSSVDFKTALRKRVTKFIALKTKYEMAGTHWKKICFNATIIKKI